MANGTPSPQHDAPVGYEQITCATSTALANVPDHARYAIIVPEAQDVRYRDDGTAPTATVGLLLEAKKPFKYTGDLLALLFIEATATAKVNVAYYK